MSRSNFFLRVQDGRVSPHASIFFVSCYWMKTSCGIKIQELAYFLVSCTRQSVFLYLLLMPSAEAASLLNPHAATFYPGRGAHRLHDAWKTWRLHHPDRRICSSFGLEFLKMQVDGMRNGTSIRRRRRRIAAGTWAGVPMFQQKILKKSLCCRSWEKRGYKQQPDGRWLYVAGDGFPLAPPGAGATTTGNDYGMDGGPLSFEEPPHQEAPCCLVWVECTKGFH